jgi:hypothetical protein
VVVNTSLNAAAARWSTTHAMRSSASAHRPIDALVMGPFLVRRPGSSVAARHVEEAVAA